MFPIHITLLRIAINSLFPVIRPTQHYSTRARHCIEKKQTDLTIREKRTVEALAGVIQEESAKFLMNICLSAIGARAYDPFVLSAWRAGPKAVVELERPLPKRCTGLVDVAIILRCSPLRQIFRCRGIDLARERDFIDTASSP